MTLRLVAEDLSRHERLKIAYSAWSRGDASALIAMFAEDCEFTIIGDPVLNPQSGTRSGLTGLKDLFNRFHQEFVSREFMLERIILDGDHAAVHWHSKLQIRRTGRIVESERCDLIRFEGNLIARVLCFFDSASMAVATGRAQIPPPSQL